MFIITGNLIYIYRCHIHGLTDFCNVLFF